jgi:formate/nitrite transporter FocA (FNT family)
MPLQSDDVAARPRAVDAAFALLLTAGACVVVFTAMLPFQIGATVARQQQAAEARGLSTDSLEQTLIQFVVAEMIIAALFVGALVWTAFRIRAGRRRFRIVLIFLVVLSLVPANGQAVLVALLLVITLVLVFRRASSDWMKTMDAARAAVRARRRI